MTETEFLGFVAEILNVPRQSLTLDTVYGTIPEWDSVMQIRLVMEIEARCGVSIPLPAIAGIRTMRQFYAYVPRVAHFTSGTAV